MNAKTIEQQICLVEQIYSSVPWRRTASKHFTYFIFA